jgi:hypothetical protein
MWWEMILVHHGDGEGGHYFTAKLARVWRQMLQIILQYPYGRMNYCRDPHMVLPPRVVWDHIGMLMYFMI